MIDDASGALAGMVAVNQIVGAVLLVLTTPPMPLCLNPWRYGAQPPGRHRHRGVVF
jgi:hypothetical protein